MGGELFKAGGLWNACFDGTRQPGLHRDIGFCLRRGALEGFCDDVGDWDFGAEQARGHFCHFGIALHLSTLGGHGG